MSDEMGYLIMNMAGCKLHPSGLSLSPFSGAPRIVYRDREVAEQELLRLQALNPCAEFVLFEAVAEAIPDLHDRGSLVIAELTL